MSRMGKLNSQQCKSLSACPARRLLLLKSSDHFLLFQDMCNLYWPFADAPNLFLMTVYGCSHIYRQLSLPQPTPPKLLSFSLLFYPSLALISLSTKHTLTTCAVGTESLLWLSRSYVLIQEITQMTSHANGPPVVFLKILWSVCAIKQRL